MEAVNNLNKNRTQQVKEKQVWNLLDKYLIKDVKSKN